jgi:hypothetical protein
VPRTSATLSSFIFVCKAKIAENARARWISCLDVGTAVQNTASLIEVNGFDDVSWDD